MSAAALGNETFVETDCSSFEAAELLPRTAKRTVHFQGVCRVSAKLDKDPPC